MSVRVITGDCRDVLRTLPDESVQCCVTSPPYWGLRDYGVDGQLGLEATPDEFIAQLVEVFREVRRVLRSDGTCWVNVGDSYAGGGGFAPGAPSNQKRMLGEAWGALHHTSMERLASREKPTHARRAPSGLKPKDLIGQPWRLAFALQDDGWFLRSDIIWAKPNPMPESVTDRPTKAHEYVFLLTKAARYFYDADAVREASLYAGAVVRTNGAAGMDAGYDGHRTRAGFARGVTVPTHRNARTVWTIATEPFRDAHFATFPTELARRCILAGTSEHGACSECGAPWERMTTTEHVNPGNRTTNGDRSLANREITAGFAVRLEKRVSTTGWRPTCEHPDAERRPCVVLDPFGGAGTTGLVADRLQRDAILIELNPEYAAMARRRIERDAGMFSEVAAATAPQPKAPQQGDIFA